MKKIELLSNSHIYPIITYYKAYYGDDMFNNFKAARVSSIKKLWNAHRTQAGEDID